MNKFLRRLTLCIFFFPALLVLPVWWLLTGESAKEPLDRLIEWGTQ